MPLSRSTATELCILSALVPIICTIVATSYSTTLYASGASLGHGAVVASEISESASEVLWLGSDKRGCHSKLDGLALSLLAAAGEDAHECGFDFGEEVFSPQKSPLLYFDFIEFFGHSVAPPLDVSSSKHYDLADERLLEWSMHVIEQGRFGAFLTEPPCTTFSPAADPAVRSYACPQGFDLTCRKTLQGNLSAYRSFLLLRHGRRYKRPCGKKQPRLSKMAWLQAWQRLKELGFEESVVASCQFGSPQRKEFRFLTYLVDAVGLEVRCLAAIRMSRLRVPSLKALQSMSGNSQPILQDFFQKPWAEHEA